MPKPSISIIGPGRLGGALALALHSKGYPLNALVARTKLKAEKAVKNLKTKSAAVALTELEKLPTSDVIIITTPDDTIPGVAKKLQSIRPPTTVLHTSGALSSKILDPLRKLGFRVGSMHPLVSVSDPKTGAKAMRGGFFCVEGDREARQLAERIVRDLGGYSFSIKPENKALYHAAALTAAGHLTALVDLAIEMLAAAGLKRSEAQKVLLPLVESAVRNLQKSPPEKALTGTFARGDVATVEQHLRSLSPKKTAASGNALRQVNSALEVYKLLGLRSVQLSKKNGLDAKTADRIVRLLKS